MTAYVVMEFNGELDRAGNAVWPPSKVTDVNSAGTVTIAPTTSYIVICASANGAYAFSPRIATAADIQLLQYNNPIFPIAGKTPRTLNFL